jgi:hypothetical protein
MTRYFKALLIIPALSFSAGALSTDSESIKSLDKLPKSNVTIEWVEPTKFRDVKHPSMSRQRYRESVFLELETFISDLAESLPEGQKLNIKVTDLDMAGTVQTPAMAGIRGSSMNSNFDINEYRIMRDIDIPRMDFSYELRNADGEIIQQEDVELKDLSYLSRVSKIHKSTPLKYEKEMISRWFKEKFLNES